MDRTFWLVWNENGGPPRAKHDSLESAQREAERLARAVPGSRFYVLVAKGYVERTDLHRVYFDDNDDGIPF